MGLPRCPCAGRTTSLAVILDVGACTARAGNGLRAPSRCLRHISSGAIQRHVQSTPKLTLKRPVRSRNYPLVPYLVGPDTYPMNDLPTFLAIALHIRRRAMADNAFGEVMPTHHSQPHFSVASRPSRTCIFEAWTSFLHRMTVRPLEVVPFAAAAYSGHFGRLTAFTPWWRETTSCS